MYLINEFVGRHSVNMLRFTTLVIVLVFVFAIGASVPGVFDIPAFPEDVRTSPFAKNDARIISGQPAKERQITYQLSLRMVSTTGQVFACGASLIHHKWALTAAHCTVGRTYVLVRMGLTEQTRPKLVLETFIWYDHPNYNIHNLNHDITLLFLGKEVQYTEYIQPIRIQQYQAGATLEGKTALASGFGLTHAGGSISEYLNYVYLRIISNQLCSFIYGTSVVIDSTICAVGGETPAQSTCDGDSGGPLVVEESDGEKTLVGVVSFVSGSGCASGNPSGYVRPSHYHDWFTFNTGIDFNLPH